MPDLLRCPHCHAPLRRAAQMWSCANRHSFDVARQGHVNLTVGRARHHGDTPEMLDARATVLAAGHFDTVTDAVIEACHGAPPGALLEVGAGTAHHVAAVQRAMKAPAAIAMDASVAAARRAARVPGVTAIVSDAWQPWPILDGVLSAVLTIFAPRNMAEAARVLVSRGVAVVVFPGPEHLAEIRDELALLGSEPEKARRLFEQAHGHLEVVDVADVATVRTIDRGLVGAIAAMGPSAHHVDALQLQERTSALPAAVDVTIAVRVATLRR